MSQLRRVDVGVCCCTAYGTRHTARAWRTCTHPLCRYAAGRKNVASATRLHKGPQQSERSRLCHMGNLTRHPISTHEPNCDTIWPSADAGGATRTGVRHAAQAPSRVGRRERWDVLSHRSAGGGRACAGRWLCAHRFWRRIVSVLGHDLVRGFVLLGLWMRQLCDWYRCRLL
jgi:hypothetical protein